MENTGISVSKRRLRLELYSVLLVALLILFIRKTPPVASVLASVPVLGASLPFFILSLGILAWIRRTGRNWSDCGLSRPQSLVLTAAWGVGAGAVRLLSSHALGPTVTQLTGAEPILSRIEPVETVPLHKRAPGSGVNLYGEGYRSSEPLSQELLGSDYGRGNG